MRLEHVNLTVSDVERSVDFYSKLLGLQVRWEGRDETGAPMAHVGTDSHYLALFQASQEGRAAHDYSTVGVNHVGFVVDDLDAARERAEGLGTTVHLEADYDPGRRIYVTDPDGIEIELVEYAA